MLKLNKKPLLVIVIFLTTVIAFFIWNQKGKTSEKQANQTPQASFLPSAKDPPQIVATKPDPLNDNIVSGSDIIEITFNRTLENVGEFKVRIEPKIEYKVELSGDRKTARVIPTKPYPLGTSFTLSIGPDTKFDGVGNWGQSKDFHFRTIKYTGV